MSHLFQALQLLRRTSGERDALHYAEMPLGEGPGSRSPISMISGDILGISCHLLHLQWYGPWVLKKSYLSNGL